MKRILTLCLFALSLSLMIACGGNEQEEVADTRTPVQVIHDDRGMSVIPDELRTPELATEYLRTYGVKDPEAINHIEYQGVLKQEHAALAFELNPQAALHIEAELLTSDMADWLVENGTGWCCGDINLGHLVERPELLTPERVLKAINRDVDSSLQAIPGERITPAVIRVAIDKGEIDQLGKKSDLPWSRELVTLAWAKNSAEAYEALPDKWKDLRMSEQRIRQDPSNLCDVIWVHRVADGGRLSKLALSLTDDERTDDQVSDCVPERFKLWQFGSKSEN